MIICEKTTLTKKQLIDFLFAIDKDFPIPLSDKVNIAEYAEKLMDKADLVAEIEEDRIKGLAAGYTENIIDNSAYIALVGVQDKFRGQGIAKQLVKTFIKLCQEKNIHSINLYTHQTNVPAIKMYGALGFEIYDMQDEVRTQDIHYIYYLKMRK